MLTPSQQKLVVECMGVADLAVRAILKKLPQLSRLHGELQSAAYEGICRAAKTYDKEKSSNVKGYFYVAARNAALREIENEINKDRIRLEDGLGEMAGREDGLRAMECLDELPEKYRNWIEEYVFYGKFKQVREDTNILSGRKIKQMLDDMMSRLKKKLDDFDG